MFSNHDFATRATFNKDVPRKGQVDKYLPISSKYVVFNSLEVNSNIIKFHKWQVLCAGSCWSAWLAPIINCDLLISIEIEAWS